jgi:AcrR family transcriptional regulator
MDDSPKGRILRAAARLFAERGYQATTVRELAAAVGIQSGSLFHHFRDKESILEAVMLEVIELNSERLTKALEQAGEAPAVRLRGLVRSELESIHGETSEAMSLLVREWKSLSQAGHERVLALRTRYEALWLDTLRAAESELVAVQPFVLRRFIAGIVMNTATWFRPDGALSMEQLTDQVMQLLLREAGQPT